MAHHVRSKRTATAEAACPDGSALAPLSREDDVSGVLQQIEAFDERLGELETDMESSGWDDIADFRGQLDDLRTKLRALRARTQELESVADTAWPAALEELEASLSGVGEAVEGLAAGLSPVLPE